MDSGGGKMRNTASMRSLDEKRLLSSPTYSPLHNDSLVSNSNRPPYLFPSLIHHIIVSVDLIHGIYPPLSFDLITDLMYPQHRRDLCYLGHRWFMTQ